VTAVNASEQLAQMVCRTSLSDLPSAAISAAKWSLLDALGVMLAASRLGEGCDAFVALALSAGGSGPCALIGRSEKVSAPLAALANGALSHALDFEDTHDDAALHPNASVVPAALAVAQQMSGTGGPQLLSALAVGADLICRLGLALDANIEQSGWFPPPILSVHGAAAAAGHLLNLTPRQMCHAWSLALCQTTCSNEFKRSPDSVLRAIRDGFATQAGTQAAWLAKYGVTGFERPFEGESGLFALYAHGHYSAARLLGELGVLFEGANVSYKPWPSCRGTHAFIEAALQYRDAGMRTDQVAEISMLGSSLQQMLGEPLPVKRVPRTAIDAKFSAPFCAALAFTRGRVGLEDFVPGAIEDPAVLAVANRATLTVDPTLGPRQVVSGTMRVRLHSGEWQERRVAEPLGSPSNPMSESQLIQKFRDCAALAYQRLRPAAESRLIDMILNLERLENLDQTLFETLQEVETAEHPSGSLQFHGYR
jgi:2-methylcitrate dehydratase PrpD